MSGASSRSFRRRSHMELFHHAEKRLLVARGILKEAVVRELTPTLDQHLEDRIAFLNGTVFGALDRLGVPRNPAAGK